MKADKFDPDARARAKAASREADELALQQGVVSREELQRINGGGNIFRGSVLVLKPHPESPDHSDD